MSVEPRKIHHPGHLFDFGPTLPYHDLCKYILDNPPEGYVFDEATIAPNDADMGAFNQFLVDWKNKAIELGLSANEWEDMASTSRNPVLNMMVPPNVPVWITTLPIYAGPNEWMVEIEDWATLFYPFIGNNYKCWGDIPNEPSAKFFKALFSLDNFKGVVTHIAQTIVGLKAIFGEELAHKFHYMPVGYPTTTFERTNFYDEDFKILFHGSFNHSECHFMLRGGRELVAGFVKANAANPKIKLTIVYGQQGFNHTPEDTRNIVLNHPDITYIGERIEKEALLGLIKNHHVMGLPAFRVHSVSTTQALMHGMPVICSDGWGFSEYIRDGYNGIVCRGIKASWIDNAGIMREKYDWSYVNEPVADAAAEAFKYLARNREIYRFMSEYAATQTAKKYSNEARNKVLKNIFDKNFSSAPVGELVHGN